jgi:hypothetical protein
VAATFRDGGDVSWLVGWLFVGGFDFGVGGSLFVRSKHVGI